jgi:hypothetical protein
MSKYEVTQDSHDSLPSVYIVLYIIFDIIYLYILHESIPDDIRKEGGKKHAHLC